MPMICELCGAAEEAAGVETRGEHLHLCAGCLEERRTGTGSAGTEAAEAAEEL